MNTESTSDFYRQLEDRFRTSRHNIKERLRVYEPLLYFVRSRTTPAQEKKPSALDLGCGRGEWLEILIDLGFDAEGVDLDTGMLEACHDRGLAASQRDALEKLRELPDNSLSLVSAFHLVEHVGFDVLLDLVAQAHRVLAPGGLLLMETPNPENICVGTSSFYLDPTHNTPIPHALLAFVTEYSGFASHKIWRVNETRVPQPTEQISLNDLLFGVSPDYAVIAIKQTSPDVVRAFHSETPSDLGLALDLLPTRYDAQLANRFAALEQRIAELEQLPKQNPRSFSVVRPVKRVMRFCRLLYVGIRNHGMSGIWWPLTHHVNANPSRRNHALRKIKQWQIPWAKPLLFDETAIRADLVQQPKPESVKMLPPSARAIDDIVLTNLYTHIEE